MAKDRALNPATAALKASKNRAIKKSKNERAAQRTEKLARYNPQRIQRQIDELQALESAGNGKLRPKEKQQLEELEKQLRGVNKARETLGERAPSFGGDRGGRDGGSRGGRGRGGSVLGKRGRDGRRLRDGEPESSETDEDVRDIPMPRDTPPPVPRRPRPGNANDTPLGDRSRAPPEKPKAQIVYSGGPNIRDLTKEATKFMPSVVQQKMKQIRGEGRLLEPEEAEKLEKEGYRVAVKAAEEGEKEAVHNTMASSVMTDGTRAEKGMGGDEDEMARFERELRQVEMEDVEDETKRDVQGAANAAVQEAEFKMMAAEAEGPLSGEKAEKALRQVEMEEVEDDGT